MRSLLQPGAGLPWSSLTPGVRLSLIAGALHGEGAVGLYQVYSIMVDPNEPLAINASGGSTLFPGTVGQSYAQNFFLSGRAGPYSWAVASGQLPPGQLPPGLTLQTFGDPGYLVAPGPPADLASACA
jgi:hypothetical protein